MNVNKTVLAAYEQGADLQKTVDFIRLFTGSTTLDPLRITVYNDDAEMIADNPAATIHLYDSLGNRDPELMRLWNSEGNAAVCDMTYNNNKIMVSSRTSHDGRVHSFAALPYEGEVLDFLSVDPMVWIVVVILGVFSSVVAYLGVRTVCRNVYALKSFAQAISSDRTPEDIDSLNFSNDELGDVSRNLLTLYRDKIHAEREKMHHEQQIGMNVSHELKTPVGIIKGYLESILKNEDMPDELKHKFLVRAKQSADRLANLVSDVSMVFSLRENEVVIEGTAFNFHDTAARIADDIKQGHVADSMTFEYTLPEKCVVTGRETLVINVLLNLVYNAAQHSGGTRISLRWLRESGGQHYFTFADNGVGVAPEHLPRLFDLFYRVDAGRSRKNGGSGLGLSLVHRTIKAMGGSITVENAETGGLQFTFSLPAADA